MVWKMEFQTRGAPHLHCMISSKLPWRKLLDLCCHYWLRYTNNPDDHGVDLQSIRSEAAVSIYLSQHFSKDSQNVAPKEFERPGRYWGFLGFKNVPFVPPRTFEGSEGGESVTTDNVYSVYYYPIYRITNE
jgi:hypothetical protein